MIEKLLSNEQPVLVTTASELEDAFRAVLSDLLVKHEEERKDARITRNAAKKRLNKDLSTLYRWEKAHMLHPIRIGRSVYYLESEIKDIEEGRV